jgi:predicted Zn-dependent protease
MKSLHFRRWALCWFMCFSSMVLASSSASLDKLEGLIRQQDHVAAWQLARELMPEQEGEPRFDYLFGLAARSAGQLHQAVFALERALFSQPQSLDIRLALAVSYYELGNLPAAERELTLLEKSTLPGPAATLVQNYRQQIEKLRHPEKGYWQNWL